MSDEPQPLGGNQAKDFVDRLEAYEALLDKIEKLKGEAKLLKEAAKQEGYDVKAFTDVEKLKRKGFAQIFKQIEFQMVLTTYLKASGLPATLEEARRAAEAEAEAAPTPKSEQQEKRRRGRMN
jgi:uncharacterized protein (UPF0335 family)